MAWSAPGRRYGLPLEERTLAQALKEAGYETAICGKWHLGHFQPAYLPTRRGFDHEYGHYNGALDYFTHIRDGGFDWHRDDRASRDEGYSTHLIAREAARLVAEHDPARPLFLYVPFNAVHSPHQVPESYKAPYANLPEPRRTYAGMLAAMDEAVGQIVAAIDRKGMRPNTLFIFSSDNGGPAPGRVTSNGPLRGQKATLYEGGVRVPACATWEGHIRPGTVVNAPLHMVDWYPTLLNLAGASLAQTLPLDGRDAWPAITQGAASPHDAILLNATPNSGGDPRRRLEAGPQRLGRIATTRRGGREARGPEPEPVELFNLATDPYEKNTSRRRTPPRSRSSAPATTPSPARRCRPRSRPKPAGFQSPKVWGEVE